MTEAEIFAFRTAGEIYGKLRSKLDGGRLTMAYSKDAGTIDYRWAIRRKRKEHTVNQSVRLLSLVEADEVDSLLEMMLSGLNDAVARIAE